MEPLQSSGCGCTKPAVAQVIVEKKVRWGKISLLGLLILGLWLVVYSQLEPFSSYLTYSLLEVKKGSHLVNTAPNVDS